VLCSWGCWKAEASHDRICRARVCPDLISGRVSCPDMSGVKHSGGQGPSVSSQMDRATGLLLYRIAPGTEKASSPFRPENTRNTCWRDNQVSGKRGEGQLITCPQRRAPRPCQSPLRSNPWWAISMLGQFLLAMSIRLLATGAFFSRGPTVKIH